MSGDSLWLMTVRGSSQITSVFGGAGAVSSGSASQPSSNPSRTSLEKRCAIRVAAPRPLIASTGTWMVDMHCIFIQFSRSRTWCRVVLSGIPWILVYFRLRNIVIDRLTEWQAASAHESLVFIFVGVAITLPAIVIYTIFMHASSGVAP